MEYVTAEQFRSLFNYNPETGEFTRLAARCNRVKVGQLAGTKANGYLFISVDARKYPAHRLAFLWMTGFFPVGVVDHINGVRSDNKWSNLRDANASVNSQNQRLPQNRNKSGYLGVSWAKHMNRWTAQITVQCRTRNLGYFDDPKEAHAVYVAAKRRLHEGCTL